MKPLGFCAGLLLAWGLAGLASAAGRIGVTVASEPSLSWAALPSRLAIEVSICPSPDLPG